MSLARFVVKDAYTPGLTEKELDNLIPKIHGVMHWAIHPDGEVTIAYDRRLTSDELIEETLKGMGFKLKHIFDHPDAGEAEAQVALKD